MSKTPMRFILRAPERIVNIPREVAVIKTKKPRALEKIKVISASMPKTNSDVIL